MPIDSPTFSPSSPVTRGTLRTPTLLSPRPSPPIWSSGGGPRTPSPPPCDPFRPIAAASPPPQPSTGMHRPIAMKPASSWAGMGAFAASASAPSQSSSAQAESCALSDAERLAEHARLFEGGFTPLAFAPPAALPAPMASRAAAGPTEAFHAHERPHGAQERPLDGQDRPHDAHAWPHGPHERPHGVHERPHGVHERPHGAHKRPLGADSPTSSVVPPFKRLRPPEAASIAVRPGAIANAVNGANGANAANGLNGVNGTNGLSIAHLQDLGRSSTAKLADVLLENVHLLARPRGEVIDLLRMANPGLCINQAPVAYNTAVFEATCQAHNASLPIDAARVNERITNHLAKLPEAGKLDFRAHIKSGYDLLLWLNRQGFAPTANVVTRALHERQWYMEVFRVNQPLVLPRSTRATSSAQDHQVAAPTV